MNLDRHTPSGPSYCAEKLQDGLSTGSMEQIQYGISMAHDLFVQYVTQERRDDLLELGRSLSAAYFPHRAEISKGVHERASYLGELRAVANLCEYISRRQLPECAWQAIGRSKYSKPVMQALLHNGAMLATALSHESGLPHESQLRNVVEPLIEANLVRREKFGKNVWYSLTSIGRLTATTHLVGRGKVVTTTERDGNVEPASVDDLTASTVDWDYELDQASKASEQRMEERLPHHKGERIATFGTFAITESASQLGDRMLHVSTTL